MAGRRRHRQGLLWPRLCGPIRSEGFRTWRSPDLELGSAASSQADAAIEALGDIGFPSRLVDRLASTPSIRAPWSTRGTQCVPRRAPSTTLQSVRRVPRLRVLKEIAGRSQAPIRRMVASPYPHWRFPLPTTGPAPGIRVESFRATGGTPGASCCQTRDPNRHGPISCNIPCGEHTRPLCCGD